MRFRAWSKPLLSLVCAFLFLSTFLSSGLSLVRELRGRYLAFSSEEVQAADYIARKTDAKALFLTDADWHLNPVAALAGRNILCGSDIYLYFHGLDARERRQDVQAMLEEPEKSTALYRYYGVDYLYIGIAERRNYNLDLDYFESHFERIYHAHDLSLYRVGTKGSTPGE